MNNATANVFNIMFNLTIEGEPVTVHTKTRFGEAAYYVTVETVTRLPKGGNSQEVALIVEKIVDDLTTGDKDVIVNMSKARRV